MAPAQVNSTNVLDVWRHIQGGRPKNGTSNKNKLLFDIGDYVCVSKTKGIFEKGYEHNWSYEVFIKISKIILREPVVYKIVDLNGEDIESAFYKHELQKVDANADTAFKIDKILEKRGPVRDFLLSGKDILINLIRGLHNLASE